MKNNRHCAPSLLFTLLSIWSLSLRLSPRNEERQPVSERTTTNNSLTERLGLWPEPYKWSLKDRRQGNKINHRICLMPVDSSLTEEQLDKSEERLACRVKVDTYTIWLGTDDQDSEPILQHMKVQNEPNKNYDFLKEGFLVDQGSPCWAELYHVFHALVEEGVLKVALHSCWQVEAEIEKLNVGSNNGIYEPWIQKRLDKYLLPLTVVPGLGYGVETVVRKGFTKDGNDGNQNVKGGPYTVIRRTIPIYNDDGEIEGFKFEEPKEHGGLAQINSEKGFYMWAKNILYKGKNQDRYISPKLDCEDKKVKTNETPKEAALRLMKKDSPQKAKQIKTASELEEINLFQECCKLVLNKHVTTCQKEFCSTCIIEPSSLDKWEAEHRASAIKSAFSGKTAWEVAEEKGWLMPWHVPHPCNKHYKPPPEIKASCSMEPVEEPNKSNFRADILMKRGKEEYEKAEQIRAAKMAKKMNSDS